jgi:thiamine pyrophosphate-dependent acetolactate synthase large subunit-like protein
VSGMSLVEAVRALHAVRGSNDVVISAMGAAREWMALGTHPLDWVFVPSSMGQATSLGLGMALARPDRRIIVLNGDGGMLMNLGSLVTLSACAPPNLVVLLLDNGVYEITGAQPTPSAAEARVGGDAIDFAALARASGLRSVFRYRSLEEWQRGIPAVLAAPGPSFAVLEVAPVPEAKGPRSPGPAPERARRFMAALDQKDG